MLPVVDKIKEALYPTEHCQVCYMGRLALVLLLGALVAEHGSFKPLVYTVALITMLLSPTIKLLFYYHGKKQKNTSNNIV